MTTSNLLALLFQLGQKVEDVCALEAYAVREAV